MTADFVKKVNDAFDVLNVRSYGKKAASPISANSIQHLKVLSDMKAESESWYVNVKNIVHLVLMVLFKTLMSLPLFMMVW